MTGRLQALAAGAIGVAAGALAYAWWLRRREQRSWQERHMRQTPRELLMEQVQDATVEMERCDCIDSRVPHDSIRVGVSDQQLGPPDITGGAVRAA